jgi:hypothetical protein
MSEPIIDSFSDDAVRREGDRTLPPAIFLSVTGQQIQLNAIEPAAEKTLCGQSAQRDKDLLAMLVRSSRDDDRIVKIFSPLRPARRAKQDACIAKCLRKGVERSGAMGGASASHFCSVPTYSAINFAFRSEVNSVYLSFSFSFRKISPQTGMLRVPCARTTRLPSIEDITRSNG